MENSPKILIVDDDVKNIQVLAANLKEVGYQIIIARDGKQAIVASLETKPDLILLDIMMPVMDGYEACRILKADPQTANIPILFLSAKDQIEDTVKAFELGAVDYIVKPPRKKELLARVATHIELKNKTEALRRERRELLEKNKKIESSLELARNIQLQVMPVQSPRKGISFRYCPTEQVGGDFFDFLQIDENRVGIFISDVSGHGVAAAFITLLLKRTLYYEKEAHVDPAILLVSLNESLFYETSHSFISAFYGIIDFNDCSMIYSSAGHYPPYYINGNDVNQLDCPGKSLPLGILSNELLESKNKLYTNDSLSLKKGSRLLFFTDGLIEAINVNKENTETVNNDFGSEKMIDVCSSFGERSAEGIVNDLIGELQKYCESSKFEDDVCLIAVEI